MPEAQLLDSLRIEMKQILSQLREELASTSKLELDMIAVLQEEEDNGNGHSTELVSNQEDVKHLSHLRIPAAEAEEKSDQIFEAGISPLREVVSKMADLFSSLSAANQLSGIKAVDGNGSENLDIDADANSEIRAYSSDLNRISNTDLDTSSTTLGQLQPNTQTSNDSNIEPRVIRSNAPPNTSPFTEKGIKNHSTRVNDTRMQIALQTALEAMCSILANSVIDSALREVDDEIRLTILEEQKNALITQMQEQQLRTEKNSVQLGIDLLAADGKELLERLSDCDYDLLADSVAHGEAELAMILRSCNNSPELPFFPNSSLEESITHESLATTVEHRADLNCANDKTSSVQIRLEELLSECQSVLQQLLPDEAASVLNHIERSQNSINRNLVSAIASEIRSHFPNSEYSPDAASQPAPQAAQDVNVRNAADLDRDTELLLRDGGTLAGLSSDEAFELIVGAILLGEAQVARLLRSKISTVAQESIQLSGEDGIRSEPTATMSCSYSAETQQACDEIVELLAGGKRLLESLPNAQLIVIADRLCHPQGLVASRLAKALFEDRFESEPRSQLESASEYAAGNQAETGGRQAQSASVGRFDLPMPSQHSDRDSDWVVLNRVNCLLGEGRRLFQILQPEHLAQLSSITVNSRVGRYLVRTLLQDVEQTPRGDRTADSSALAEGVSDGQSERGEEPVPAAGPPVETDAANRAENSLDLSLVLADRGGVMEAQDPVALPSTGAEVPPPEPAAASGEPGADILLRITELLAASEVLISTLPDAQASCLLDEIDRSKTPLSQSLVWMVRANHVPGDDPEAPDDREPADSDASRFGASDEDLEQVMESFLQCAKSFSSLSPEEIFGLIAGCLVQSTTEFSSFLKSRISAVKTEPAADSAVHDPEAQDRSVSNGSATSHLSSSQTYQLIEELLCKGGELLDALPAEHAQTIVTKIEEQKSGMATEILGLISSPISAAAGEVDVEMCVRADGTARPDLDSTFSSDIDHLVVRGQYMALSEFLARQGHELLENAPGELFDLMSASIAGESSDLAAILRFKICGGADGAQESNLVSCEREQGGSEGEGVADSLNKEQGTAQSAVDMHSTKEEGTLSQVSAQHSNAATDIESRLSALIAEGDRLMSALPSDQTAQLLDALERPISPLAMTIGQSLSAWSPEPEQGHGSVDAGSTDIQVLNHRLMLDLMEEGRELLHSAASLPELENCLGRILEPLTEDRTVGFLFARAWARQLPTGPPGIPTGPPGEESRASRPDSETPTSLCPQDGAADARAPAGASGLGAGTSHAQDDTVGHDDDIPAPVRTASPLSGEVGVETGGGHSEAAGGVASVAADPLDRRRRAEVQASLARAMDVISAVVASSALDAAIREVDEGALQSQVAATTSRYMDSLAEHALAADRESLRAFAELLTVYGGQLLERAPESSFDLLAEALVTSHSEIAAVIRAATPPLKDGRATPSAGVEAREIAEQPIEPAPASPPATPTGECSTFAVSPLIMEGKRLLDSLSPEQTDGFISAIKQLQSPVALRVARALQSLDPAEEGSGGGSRASVASAGPSATPRFGSEAAERAALGLGVSGEVLELMGSLISSAALDSAVRELDEAALQQSIAETTGRLLALMRDEVEAANLESFRHGLDLLVVHGQWLMERASDPSFALLARTIASGDSEVASILRSAAASPDVLTLPLSTLAEVSGESEEGPDSPAATEDPGRMEQAPTRRPDGRRLEEDPWNAAADTSGTSAPAEASGGIVESVSALITSTMTELLALDEAVREMDEAAPPQGIAETADGLRALARGEAVAASLESIRSGLDLLIEQSQWLMEHVADPPAEPSARPSADDSAGLMGRLLAEAGAVIDQLPESVSRGTLRELEEGIAGQGGSGPGISVASALAAGLTAGAGDGRGGLEDGELAAVEEAAAEAVQQATDAAAAVAAEERDTDAPLVAELEALLSEGGTLVQLLDSESQDRLARAVLRGEGTLAAALRAAAFDATPDQSDFGLGAEGGGLQLSEGGSSKLADLVREGLLLLDAMPEPAARGLVGDVEARAKGGGRAASLAHVLLELAASGAPPPAERIEGRAAAVAASTPRPEPESQDGGEYDGGEDAAAESPGRPCTQGEDSGPTEEAQVGQAGEVRPAGEAGDGADAADEGALTGRSSVGEALLEAKLKEALSKLSTVGTRTGSEAGCGVCPAWAESNWLKGTNRGR